MPANHRLITCFLPSGRALGVLERLRKELGMHSMVYHHARGVGTGSRTGGRRVVASEREVITLLVAEEGAEELFRFLFEACGLQEPNSGMIFMEKPLRAAGFVSPESAPPQDIQ